MIKKDFEEFTNSAPMNPPNEVSSRILARVRGDLSPTALKVFSKLSLVHFFSALVTLSICPQFGFRLLGEGHGLMGYFMQLGEFACAVACGTFFLGSSVMVAAMVLRIEEVRVIRSNKLLELGALTLLSIGFFIMLNAEITMGYLITWALGSLIGGIITLEAAFRVKANLHKS